METQRETLSKLFKGRLTEKEITMIVDAEKTIIKAAVKEERPLPYSLSLRDSKADIAHEEVPTVTVRNAILGDNLVDALSWQPTSEALHPISKELTIVLRSPATELTEKIRL